jgi:chromosome segregation ATPase
MSIQRNADGSVASGWLDSVLHRVQVRNEVESEPFLRVCKSHQDLWAKAVYLDSVRIAAKHNIAILEHESSEQLNRNDSESAVRNVLAKFSVIHGELQPFRAADKEARKGPVINLSKTIYEQRKLISNLEEELKMAKSQISEAFSSLASVQESGKKSDELQEQVRQLETRLAERDKTVASLQAENAELTTRIITEKNKSAKQLDEMNELLAGRKPFPPP